MERVYESDESNLEVLEVLSNLYNEMNKEDGLRRSLSRLFNLYLASENYRKAGDTLERILDVDPYGEGHYDRLVNLEGHIDAIWYKNILFAHATPFFRADVTGHERPRRVTEKSSPWKICWPSLPTTSRRSKASPATSPTSARGGSSLPRKWPRSPLASAKSK